MMKPWKTALSGFALLIGLSVSGCNPAQYQSQPANPPARMHVASPFQGLTQFAQQDADAALRRINNAIAQYKTGAAPLTLIDTQTCIAWVDSQIPAWSQSASGLIPTDQPAGLLDGFVELKITAVTAQGLVQNVTAQVPANFAHYCGAALQSDTQAVINFLAKVGISVGGTIGTGGILGIFNLPMLLGASQVVAVG